MEFSWSDGHLEVTKKLKFDSTYIAELTAEVKLDGHDIPFSIAWRGGFGDATAYHASLSTYVFYSQAGKVEQLNYKNVGQPKQPDAPKLQPGPLEFVGIDDTYFAAAFLPPLQQTGALAGQPATLDADLSLTDWSVARDFVGADGKTDKDFVPQMAAGSGRGGPIEVRLFVGPENLDDLKAIRPPLYQLVQFGWLSIIAEPLFYTLRWMHKWIPNYGWAIVLLTVGINMVLLPLKIKTLKSGQKMQKVAPEIRTIQDRYKKYSMRDPRKAKMQEEIMAVYSREGINPLGGCLPQLVQLPIWYGLYRMLTYTIELRHAPWIGWIHDLSARDPYLILPILMALTMYLATEDDSHAFHRRIAATHDGPHAHHVRRNVYHFSRCQRPDAVYSHYQRCCGGPAAVSKPKDADARPREGAQEEKLNCLHRRVSNSNAARFSQSVK